MSRPEVARTDFGIQSLRGVAIILMVAGHVIGSDAGYGLRVGDDSAWRFAYRALEDLRMPLFSVMSGYVYGYRPLRDRAGMRPLALGKARRLLIPFVVVCTVYFFVQMLAPGTNSSPEIGELWRAYVYGYQHLWFVQAIFLVFLVVGLLDARGSIRSFRGWATALGVSAVAYVALYVPAVADVFSIAGALRLLPFFLLGYGFHRYGDALLTRRVLLVVVAALVPLYALRLTTIAVDAEMAYPVERALSSGVGFLGVLMLLAVREHLRSRALVWLGSFSFGIYLLHVFGSAGARIAAQQLGVEATAALFVLSLAAGLALPVAFELLLGRYALVSWAVLGQRPRASRPSVRAEVRTPTSGPVA